MTKILISNIDSSAVQNIQGPRITQVYVTDSSYNALDDTAVDSTSGGYIKIVGTGFVTGCIVVVNNTIATSTTFVSSTEVRAQIQAQAAGSYTLYVSNTDGGLAIKAIGVSFSGFPAWVTSSSQTLSSSTVSFQFAASSDSAVTYAVDNGSSLPPGLSLSSSGLLSGTATGSSGTVYSFTLQATDAESQNTSRTFTVTLSFGEPYFKNTVLLVHANGTNAATNNTFLDSSTNALTVTRNGTPNQGSFSPFSQTGWSNYTAGGINYLQVGSNTPESVLHPTNSDFTMECWVYLTSNATSMLFGNLNDGTGSGDFWWMINNNSGTYTMSFTWNYPTPTVYKGSGYVSLNTWHHLAITRSGSNLRMYVDGNQLGTTDTSIGSTTIGSSSNAFMIGHESIYANAHSDFVIQGYISNFRYVKGSALYTGSTYSVPTSALTAISGTVVLTCQSNKFVDNSSNALSITPIGTPTVQAFSPFAPSSAYSTSTIGGSMYFSGTSDYLSTGTSSSAFTFGTGDWTVEMWVYNLQFGNRGLFQSSTTSGGMVANSGGGGIQIYLTSSNTIGVSINSTWTNTATITMKAYAWHHVALVKYNNNVKLYIDGVSDSGFGTVADTTNYTATYACVGGYYTTSYLCNSYISNLRVLKGTAQYTSNFTLPSSPVTAITNTQFLLNGTNAAIYDQTAKNDIQTLGSAQLSTTQSKFGGSSMYFNGSTDYLLTMPGQMSSFGTGDFTIEHWVNFTSTTSYINTISDNTYFTTSNNWIFMWNYAGAGRLSFWINNGVVCSTTNAYNNGAWHHVAVVRYNGVITIYVDGVADGTASGYGSTVVGNTSGFIIGNQNGTSRYWNGYIDELRITRYARYTANFTAPTAAFEDQ